MFHVEHFVKNKYLLVKFIISGEMWK